MRGCPHSPRPHRICEHLLFPPELEGDADAPGFRLIFQGSEWTTLCSACADTTPVLAECCDACRRDYLHVDTFGSFDGFGGTTPEPRDRDAGYTLVQESIDIRSALKDCVLAMVPIAKSGRARWLLWTASRRLVTIELPSGEILARTEPIAVERDAEPGEAKDPAVSLQVSDDGRYAALLLEKKRHGIVVEVATGATIAPLDRGDYHPDVSEWPFAFTEHRGRTLAVHAIAWNRLGILDLDARAPFTPDETEEEGHDYFLGPLVVSPGGKWIASAGWVWQPVGIVRVFRLDRWLEGKRSREDVQDRSLNQTGYWWNGANLWLDDDTLLVPGLGDDDQRMVDAGVLFRMESETIGACWPGLPLAPIFHDRAGGLVYVGGATTSVWDASTGDRVAHAPTLPTVGFHPSARHTAGIEDPEGVFALGFLQRR